MSDEELEKRSEVRQAYLKEHFAKITKENFDEFIDWCVEDVYSQQDEETKQKVRNSPPEDDERRYLFARHFGPCLTIRNMYLWRRDYSEFGDVDVDGLSWQIYKRVIERIRNEK